MKNRYTIKTNCFLLLKKRRKNTIILGMKITVLLIFLATFTATAGLFGQSKINLSVKKASLSTVLQKISSTTSYCILYSSEDINKIKNEITLKVQRAKIEDVLDVCMKNSGLKYTINDNTVIISPVSVRQKNFNAADKPIAIKENVIERDGNAISKIRSIEQQKLISIRGKVTSINGNPIPGVNVMIKGSGIGTSADKDGNYSIQVNPDDKALIFSFIGMTKLEVVISIIGLSLM